MILHSFVCLSHITKSGLLCFTLFGSVNFLSHHSSLSPILATSGTFQGVFFSPSAFRISSYTTFPILLCLYVRYKLEDTSSQDAKMWLRVSLPFLQSLHLLSICLRIVGSLSLHFAVAFVTISCSSTANRYPSMCELRFDFRSQATDSD